MYIRDNDNNPYKDNKKVTMKNKGSAVIEITLMIPVILGCIYFYIMSMLYLVEHGRVADKLSEELYDSISFGYDSGAADDSVSDNDTIGIINKGVAEYEEDYENYTISVRLKVDDSNPVKSLRRWQLIADTIR